MVASGVRVRVRVRVMVASGVGCCLSLIPAFCLGDRCVAATAVPCAHA
jgi:hypothetical protein